MKMSYPGWAALSFAVLFVLPFVAAMYVVNEDNWLPVYFLLLVVIDPIYFAVAGRFAGKNIREMWSLPAICAITFLLGLCPAYGISGAALMCAGIYCVIGAAAMLVSAHTAAQQ